MSIDPLRTQRELCSNHLPALRSIERVIVTLTPAHVLNSPVLCCAREPSASSARVRHRRCAAMPRKELPLWLGVFMSCCPRSL
jgi:hypothetical protein